MVAVRQYIPAVAIGGALVAVLAVGLGTSSAVSAVSTRLDRQEVAYRARIAVEQFSASSVYPVEARVCTEKSAGLPICKVLELRSFPKHGEHDDLWVFFDAALAIYNGSLPVEDRKQFNAAMADVIAALSADGAWDVVRSRGGAGPIVATDLYLSTVAHAAKCKELSDVVTCGVGIPDRLAGAISRLAVLVNSRGQEVAAYDMASRWDAVQAVARSGLVDMESSGV